MHKKMGYFNGWKFGVPVTLYQKGAAIYPPIVSRLIRETEDAFWILCDGQKASVMYFSKTDFSYIPIPYRMGMMQPRFPVCRNRRNTNYCNRGGRMSRLDAISNEADITEVKELEGAKCNAKT